jgi:CRP-like cAMP-binding protein
MLTSATIERSVPSRQPVHAPPATKAFHSSIDLMGAPMPYGRNVEIYGQNEPAEYVYKVLSGTVRTYKVLNDGRRQIGAFYLPGDVFGLEIGEEHTFSAEAIVVSRVLVL